jgi:IPT/TIG domain
MLNRFSARTVGVGLLALVGMTFGCDGRSPSAPTPPIPSAPLTVTLISPNTGSTLGSGPVTIRGTGFQSGATITLDGAATNVTVVNDTIVTATASPHAAGTVDVVVTNPGGETSRLAGGYTYVTVPQLSVTAVSPNVGSTGGGTLVKISGTGFQPGATVSVDGTTVRVYVENSTTIRLSTSAHAAGTVDVVVTNPGAQEKGLAGGYTYAPPQSFDFNGIWAGGAGAELDDPFRFTIENNLVVSVSCGSSATLTFSLPVLVSNGEFAFLGNDGVRVSGRIVAASAAIGTINTAGCPTTAWWAEKQ